MHNKNLVFPKILERTFSRLKSSWRKSGSLKVCLELPLAGFPSKVSTARGKFLSSMRDKSWAEKFEVEEYAPNKFDLEVAVG